MKTPTPQPRIAWQNAIPYLLTPGAPPQRITWAPHPGAQTYFLTSPLQKLCFLGDRGAGGTEALVMDYLRQVGDGIGSAWQGMLVRYTYPGLEDLKYRVQKFVDLLYPDATYDLSEQLWTFKGGEQLRFVHASQDLRQFQGHVYPWMGFDRLTEWGYGSRFQEFLIYNRTYHIKLRRTLRATGYIKDNGHAWVAAEFRNGQQGVVQGYLSENLTLLAADPSFQEKIAAQDGS